MAQKKNSKKDLEQRVAKLKKKVATLTTKLSKKQSELSRTLSSVQKKLGKLRKQKFPAKELAFYRDQQMELAQTTEAIAARLRDLEQTVSMVERVGDEILQRTQVLETTAAEVANQGEGLRLPAGEPGGEVQHGVDVLRDRTQALEDHQERLHAAQEGLELQIALLSREAEAVDDAPRTGKTAVDPEVQRSGDAIGLAQKMPELQAQYSLAEEATRKLGRRTAVLEAGQDSLAEQDAKFASQLKDVEQRLSELREGAEQPGSGAAPLALEQQIALLNTDRSLNESRIEETLKKAAELEKTKYDYARHTDALADRITTLTEQVESLLALEPEHRLGALDSRGNALEQLLQDERERLDGLKESEQTLDQRLNSAIGDAASLQERISALSAGGEQLNSDIVRLEGELRKADGTAQQDRERLQAHEVRLEEQRQRLDDVVESQKKANDGTNARFATLDESRQASLDATDALRVQQVRQEHDTQSLRQSLKRRTLIGLLLLLAAGALGFLLLRGSALPEELQSAMQAGKNADDQAASAIADLERDLGVLRHKVSVLNDSLEQIAQQAAKPEADLASGLPARVGGLAQTVENLTRQDLERERESQELRKGYEQGQQESLALRTAQDQLKEELKKIADEVGKLTERARIQPAITAGTPSEQARVWDHAQKSGRYTLQLSGFHRRSSLEWFLRQHGLQSDTAVYETEFQGQAWYVVFHGIYAGAGDALAAARQLPPELASLGPWVRRIPNTGDISPR